MLVRRSTFPNLKILVPQLPERPPEAWCYLCKDFKPVGEFYTERDRGNKNGQRLMPRTICKMHDKKLRTERKRNAKAKQILS